MSEANVIFTLEGQNLTIQCSKTDKMREICQRFAIKAEKNINSLLFLYGGNQLNLDLTFDEQATSLDKTNNEMKVLAYGKESDGFSCPKNVIRATLDIKANESDNIILFNTDINNGIDVYLNNNKINR